MRLKTFHAPTMTEAMEMVRDQLGADAIIVATNEDDGARDVRITAAVEADEPDFGYREEADLDLADRLSNALDNHGVPMALTDKLLNMASHLSITDPTLALAGALDDFFTFAPLPDGKSRRPLMFIGPPGSGKTVGIAKLAVRTRLTGNSVVLITTDTVRAGAIEQLAAYAKRLQIKMHRAENPLALVEAVKRSGEDAQILIDTTGINPHSADDMNRLAEFTEALAVETVLVMAAGCDPVEAAELAVAFRAAKPARLVTTRLDMFRRLGSLLVMAESGALPFSDVSVTPDIAAGLQTLNPVSLARLLLPGEIHEKSSLTEIFQATGIK